MRDPLEHALDAVGRAVEERAALQSRLNTLLTDNHQAQRQLENARGRVESLERLVAELEVRLAAADARAERSESATRDHLARTGG